VKLVFTVHSRPHTSQMKSLEDIAPELDLAVEPFRVVLRFYRAACNDDDLE